jgi:hypothetical protein
MNCFVTKQGKQARPEALVKQLQIDLPVPMALASHRQEEEQPSIASCRRNGLGFVESGATHLLDLDRFNS